MTYPPIKFIAVPSADAPVASAFSVLIYPGDFVRSRSFWWLVGFARSRRNAGSKSQPLDGWMVEDANGIEHFVPMHDIALVSRGDDTLECLRWT